MLKKTSQFSGKAKPNTQHLNPSELAIASHDLLLGFLASTQPTIIVMITVGFEKSDRYSHPLIFLLGFLLDFENRNIN
ncbi:MAG: hypothetical protein O9350_08590 [Microcystis sp. LE19-388.1G]|jgi:hypothetical protein|nr:hypothetical protein [Microcystis sp. LE19-388.1G]